MSANSVAERAGPFAASRNFIIHQYDEINRRLTWLTLSRDLPASRSSLALLFVDAAAAMEDDSH